MALENQTALMMFRASKSNGGGSSDNQDRQPDKPQPAGDENGTNGAGQDQNQDTPDHGNAESETGNQQGGLRVRQTKLS